MLLQVSMCGIISKIKVLHLKIKVYMKNVALFTHWGKAWNQKDGTQLQQACEESTHTATPYNIP